MVFRAEFLSRLGLPSIPDAVGCQLMLRHAVGQTERVTEEWSEPEGGVLVPPRPLPPPPDTGGLLSVLSYTFRICLTERWAPLRLGAVFALLLLSRTVGESITITCSLGPAGVGTSPTPLCSAPSSDKPAFVDVRSLYVSTMHWSQPRL